MRAPWRGRRRQATRVSILMLLVASGCSTPGPPSLFVHDGPRGTVFLQRLPPGSLEAAHPASLAESTVAQVLSGVMVAPHQRLLQDILAGEAPRARALTPEDVAFLAPLLREALGRAGPNDLVRFRTRRPTGPDREATGGALYVTDGAVVFALTRYRARAARPSRTGNAHGRSPQAAGLRSYGITFVPRGVEVPLPARPPDELTAGEFRPLAIDYGLLARLEGLAPGSEAQSPGPPAGSSRASEDVPASGSGTIEERIIRQDAEIEALRREVESLRRRLEHGRPGQGR